MRGVLLFAVLAACLTGSAAGARSTATIPARSGVTAVAADGDDTSYATSATVTDCDRVFVWQTGAKRPLQLGKKQRCKGKSLGISSLSVTKGRALWLTESGSSMSVVRLWSAST